MSYFDSQILDTMRSIDASLKIMINDNRQNQ